MTLKVGIVGAGVLGRLAAFHLAGQGMKVTLFDRDDRRGSASCSWVGAGMLTPLAELEKAEVDIAEAGLRALDLWPELLGRLKAPVFFQRQGSLVVAHRQDTPDLIRFIQKVSARLPAPGSMVHLDRKGLAELEPELPDGFARAVFFPDEGQLDPRQLMISLEESLLDLGVLWETNTEVTGLRPHQVEARERRWRFDWVVDTRGLGAKPDWAELRGVRGELIRIRAPEVQLQRPVRLMHPRYPIYIVPRPDQTYLIGATSIESEDEREMTVKSCLELLSAAYSLHPGFAEAEILETDVGHRPALPSNRPEITSEPGLIRGNGLYRHGYLLAPVIAQQLVSLLLSPQSQSATAEVYDASTHA